MVSLVETNVSIEIGCRCGYKESVTVDYYNHMAWLRGKINIQEAHPHLTGDQREMMISQTCGKCWDKLFTKDEED